jgi:hypothetical protein
LTRAASAANTCSGVMARIEAAIVVPRRCVVGAPGIRNTSKSPP